VVEEDQLKQDTMRKDTPDCQQTKCKVSKPQGQQYFSRAFKLKGYMSEEHITHTHMVSSRSFMITSLGMVLTIPQVITANVAIIFPSEICSGSGHCQMDQSVDGEANTKGRGFRIRLTTKFRSLYMSEMYGGSKLTQCTVVSAGSRRR